MVLTRAMLEGDALVRMVAESSPMLRVLSEEERAASLAETLAARPPALPRGPGSQSEAPALPVRGAGQAGGDAADVWLFAYGSLIWNPALHIAEQRLARIGGWHRAFCLSTVAGRGTPDAPGLVLGLDHGGSCVGLALRVEAAVAETELAMLWRREMLSGSYQPRWVTVRGADGVAFAHAITFTIRRDGPYYTRLERGELIRRLATAAGALGSTAEYLFRTRDGLRELGIRDRWVEGLAREVERVRGLQAEGKAEAEGKAGAEGERPAPR